MKFLLILMLSCSVVFSTDVSSDLVNIMQKLNKYRMKIDNGFMIDDLNEIKNNANKYKLEFIRLRAMDTKLLLDSKNLQYAQVIDSFMLNMEEGFNLMELFLKKNDRIRAFEAYQMIELNCTKCHGLVRDWE